MKPKPRNIIVLLCSIGILSYSFISSYSFAITSENSNILKYEVDEVFVGDLKHTIRIDNPTSAKLMGGKLYVPIIRNETARHYVILYNISSSIGQPTILRDDSENIYACWSNISIAGTQTFIAELNYYVLTFSTHYVIYSSLMADYDKSSDLYKKYTQPEELIQSSNPKIVSKAQNLTLNKSNIHEKVSQIYNFVITHMHYAAQDEERGALWALENGTGDCSEYSYFFVALCRAAGIPARVQAGFAFRSLRETLEDGHMWAEYYLENYGWIPVDATWRLFDTMDYKHFDSIQSIPEVTPYANYIFNSTTNIVVIDEQKVVLQRDSSSVFGVESFVRNTFWAIQKINQARFALFLSRILGAALIFSSDAAKAEQTLLESQIDLQKAVDSWETLPQLAQSNAAEALENAEEASRSAWMLITEEFILFLIILTALMVIALIFLSRCKNR